MGRGLGFVQRKIIAHLTYQPRSSIPEMAQSFYREWTADKSEIIREPTKSQIETVRKAAKALTKRKVIRIYPGLTYEGDECWVLSAPTQTQQRQERAAKKITKPYAVK